MTRIETKHFVFEQLIPAEEAPTQTFAGPNSITQSGPADLSTDDLMNAAEVSGVLDFWNDPAEEVYDD